MLQLRKKLMAGILAAVMLISTGQGVLSDTAQQEEGNVSDADNSQTVQDNTETDQTQSDQQDAPDDSAELAEPITEEEALAKTTLMAENSNLAVYLSEETGLIALKDKKNDYIWWSYPYDVDSDKLSNQTRKEEIKSALVVKTFAADEYFSYTNSVAQGGMSIEKIDNGFKVTYDFVGTDIKIPVYYTLQEDYLDAEIPTDEITETDITNLGLSDSNPIISEINLMMSFGAGSTKDDGYMVIPDGSGAVIEFNNQKKNYINYEGQIYGRDSNLALVRAPAKTQTVNLPLLGIVKQDNALLALIESGDANASINANVSETTIKSSSYNMAWFKFQTRSKDSFFMGTRSESLTAEETGPISLKKIKVRYYPISDKNKDEISYADVALKYQDYLLNDLNIEEIESDSPLSLIFYGGTMLDKSIAGFPVSLQTPATKYKDAKQMLEELKQLGVENMVVNYSEFNKAGITERMTDEVDYSSKLGGKKDFDELLEYANTNGISLFPEMDIQEYKRSGNGYSKTTNSAVRLSKSYATQLPFEMAYGTEHPTRTVHTIMSPAFYVETVKNIANSFKKNNIQNISLANATTMLYSDFGIRNVSRTDAVSMLQESYQALKDNGISIMAEGANHYALPYVSFIQDSPLYSSNYDLFDYDIPFYQIALHGVIPMSSTAVNESSDAAKHLLLSLSTGTALEYEFMKEKPNTFATTEYEDYYYTFFDGWKEMAANEYKMAKDIIGSVINKKIVDHKMISRSIMETEFEDGTTIKIDTENLTLELNGETIDFSNYGVTNMKGAE
ncbi:MAG: hypothetical protein GX346_08510 [Clostridiales bacterium]|nr:hypothetical protein [Clostridiales bacterium]